MCRRGKLSGAGPKESPNDSIQILASRGALREMHPYTSARIFSSLYTHGFLEPVFNPEKNRYFVPYFSL